VKDLPAKKATPIGAGRVPEQIEVMAARDQRRRQPGPVRGCQGQAQRGKPQPQRCGQFCDLYHGKPVIIDVGVKRVRKTFSPQRYEIWTMQSAYHSLPTINR
jgi:hypothetical protein